MTAVGPIATRRLLGRLRRRFLGFALVVVIGGAVVAHHSEPMMDGAGHHGMVGMAAMQLCLGAFVLVGASLVKVTRGTWSLGRWKTVRFIATSSPEPALSVPAAVPRGGPELLQLLCVSRR